MLAMQIREQMGRATAIKNLIDWYNAWGCSELDGPNLIGRIYGVRGVGFYFGGGELQEASPPLLAQPHPAEHRRHGVDRLLVDVVADRHLAVQLTRKRWVLEYRH